MPQCRSNGPPPPHLIDERARDAGLLHELRAHHAAQQAPALQHHPHAVQQPHGLCRHGGVGCPADDQVLQVSAAYAQVHRQAVQRGRVCAQGGARRTSYAPAPTCNDAPAQQVVHCSRGGAGQGQQLPGQHGGEGRRPAALLLVVVVVVHDGLRACVDVRCVRACVRVCVRACVRVLMRACVDVHARVRVFMHVCMRGCACACVRASVRACVPLLARLRDVRKEPGAGRLTPAATTHTAATAAAARATGRVGVETVCSSTTLLLLRCWCCMAPTPASRCVLRPSSALGAHGKFWGPHGHTRIRDRGHQGPGMGGCEGCPQPAGLKVGAQQRMDIRRPLLACMLARLHALWIHCTCTRASARLARAWQAPPREISPSKSPMHPQQGGRRGPFALAAVLVAACACAYAVLMRTLGLSVLGHARARTCRLACARARMQARRLSPRASESA